jgi:hypothetical protein
MLFVLDNEVLELAILLIPEEVIVNVVHMSSIASFMTDVM